MKMKKLNQIIKENINSSIRNFINENVNNDPNKLLDDFSIKLDVYFDAEKKKLIRKMNFAKQMKNEIFQINSIIMGLGYEFSKIEANERNDEYIINYYIANSENWSDDEFIEHEYEITSNFNDNNYDIFVDVNQDLKNNAFISLTFNLDILDEFDL